MNKKQDVILKYIREGNSQRQISKETGICRENIRKYIKNYEAKLLDVSENLDEVEKTDIIEDITSNPKYSSSSRSKRALTDDVIERISQFLKEIKLSIYYKFIFRFCNAYSGNEKGHVERSVEFVRRKAFSSEPTFNSLNEANAHLDEMLDKLNSRILSNTNKSPFQLLDEELEYLLPDDYIGTMVCCKMYTTKIIAFYNEKEIARHDKVYGMNLWHIDIMHYSKTLFRKPKALVNSTAFKQMDSILKEIYSEKWSKINIKS